MHTKLLTSYVLFVFTALFTPFFLAYVHIFLKNDGYLIA